MVDVKLRKAKEKIASLEEQLRAAHFQVLNLRTMYEGVVGEKQGLQGQLQRLNFMLVAATVQARGKSLTLKKATIEKVQKYAGLDTKDDDGDLVLTAITREQLEEMQDDIGASDDAG